MEVLILNFSKKSFFPLLLALAPLLGTCPTGTRVPATKEPISHQIKKEIRPKKVVLFDLGGVLFDTSKRGMAGEVVCFDCFIYALGFKNPANLKNIAFKFLDTITKPQAPPIGSELAMAEDNVMPGLMCEWMMGNSTGPEIITFVNEKIDSGDYDNLFSSSIEKRLVKKVVRAIFNPATLAKHTHPIKKGIELLKACAQRKDDLKLMLLSNYAADAFEELYNRTEAQKIFKYIPPENFVVSGFIHTMKPYGTIYEYLKKEYHLDPAECVIVDDQEENIEAAKKAGFETVFIKNGNFDQARKELVEMGVLTGDRT